MKRITNIINDERVIHTQYFGDIDCDFILSAIDEWSDLIVENKNISHLIFDYTNANMDKLSKEDIMAIAKATPKLIEVRESLKMIGVMPKESDYQVTSVWSAFTAFTEDAVVPFTNIVISKDLIEAKYIVELDLEKP